MDKGHIIWEDDSPVLIHRGNEPKTPPTPAVKNDTDRDGGFQYWQGITKEGLTTPQEQLLSMAKTSPKQEKALSDNVILRYNKSVDDKFDNESVFYGIEAARYDKGKIYDVNTGLEVDNPEDYETVALRMNSSLDKVVFKKDDVIVFDDKDTAGNKFGSVLLKPVMKDVVNESKSKEEAEEALAIMLHESGFGMASYDGFKSIQPVRGGVKFSFNNAARNHTSPGQLLWDYTGDNKHFDKYVITKHSSKLTKNDLLRRKGAYILTDEARKRLSVDKTILRSLAEYTNTFKHKQGPKEFMDYLRKIGPIGWNRAEEGRSERYSANLRAVKNNKHIQEYLNNKFK